MNRDEALDVVERVQAAVDEAEACLPGLGNGDREFLSACAAQLLLKIHGSVEAANERVQMSHDIGERLKVLRPVFDRAVVESEKGGE